jgi:GT2 family glycosyltransferase
MRCAVIIYHKNILNICKREWMDSCIASIKKQTLVDFDVFELDYGGTGVKFAQGVRENYLFLSGMLENHIEAMNWLIDYLFESGYDVVFNTNIDDVYSKDRFEKQIKAIEQGAQLVSSNFVYFDDKRGVFKKMDMVKQGDIGANLNRNHNVIAHPVIAMHSSFWEQGLKYENLIGYEDLDLWKRAYKRGKKIVILPDYLLHYRIHENQITKKHKGL